jgi:hypothetical protein
MCRIIFDMHSVNSFNSIKIRVQTNFEKQLQWCLGWGSVPLFTQAAGRSGFTLLSCLCESCLPRWRPNAIVKNSFRLVGRGKGTIDMRVNAIRGLVGSSIANGYARLQVETLGQRGGLRNGGASCSGRRLDAFNCLVYIERQNIILRIFI